jgi:hypothetical protein
MSTKKVDQRKTERRSNFKAIQFASFRDESLRSKRKLLRESLFANKRSISDTKVSPNTFPTQKWKALGSKFQTVPSGDTLRAWNDFVIQECKVSSPSSLSSVIPLILTHQFPALVTTCLVRARTKTFVFLFSR